MPFQIRRTYIARRRARQPWPRESYSISTPHARMGCDVEQTQESEQHSCGNDSPSNSANVPPMMKSTS